MSEMIIRIDELDATDNCDDIEETEEHIISFDLFSLDEFLKINEYLKTCNSKDAVDGLPLFIDTVVESSVTANGGKKLVATGIGFLKLFIQSNWIGPEFGENSILNQITNEEAKDCLLSKMIVDVENVLPALTHHEFLFIANYLLKSCVNKFPTVLVARMWYLRGLFIHQQILEELSSYLYKSIVSLMGDLSRNFCEMTANQEAYFRLEFCRIFLYYDNVQKAKTELVLATDIVGINITLSGALGKRTRHQKEFLPQLVVKVEIGTVIPPKKPIPAEDCLIPKDITLNDEVRLEKIKYADEEQTKFAGLTGLQEAVVLANIFQNRKGQAKDNLADEELHVLLTCILEKPKYFSIKTTALWLRSKLECSNRRTIDRSLAQVQMIADCIKGTEHPLEDRFRYFFVAYMPLKREIQATLANIQLSLGCVKSALEGYELLEDWENVIYCYNTLQLRHKAQEIIEAELKKTPTPKLYCLLGDATDDPSYYEKAWVLSNKKSSKAQKHWAYYYYFRRKYAECIEHLQKSLEINSLQKDLWYRLAYAALVEEKWEISANAYRRYVILDPECFEAWNNLARCYSETGQKYRAWKALQEALKVDYSKWKVWDNYMLVSSEVKAFDEVIRSYHEILNLKQKHLDLPMLNGLVFAYKAYGEGDMEGFTRIKFKARLLELFGRLTSQITNDEDLWFLYSEVVSTENAADLNKKFQLLMKSHRSAVNKKDWEDSEENCKQVLYVVNRLLKVGLLTKNNDNLMSCKMAATNTLTKVKKLFPSLEIDPKLTNNLAEVEKILKEQNL